MYINYLPKKLLYNYLQLLLFQTDIYQK